VLRRGPSGQFALAATPSLAGLAALGAQQSDPGQLVWVESLGRPFLAQDGLVGAAVPGQVVHSLDGQRTWRSMSGASPLASPWRTRTDWHVDAVLGSVEGDGSAAHPVSSWLELATRLDGQQLLPGTTITLHSDLAEVVDASRLIPDPTGLVISGDAGATTVLAGTVLSYTGESLVAPGEAPILRSAAVADWTPLEGYRIRFTTGAAAGAYTTVAVANPAGAGLDRARIPAPCLCAYPTPTYPVPGAGSAFVVERLPAILGYMPPTVNAGTPTILTGVAFPEALPPDVNVVDGQSYALFGCTGGDTVFRGNRTDVQGCRFGSPAGFVVQFDANMPVVFSSTIHWGLASAGFALTDHVVWQEGLYVSGGVWSLHHTGCFDNGFGDGLALFAPGSFVFLYGVLYGSGNSDYGVDVLYGGSCVSYTNLPIIAGAINDAAIAGVGMAWAGFPPGGVVGANLSGIVNP
jgi:hypothetical protein